MAGLGDTDGDGVPDWAVGADDADHAGEDAGAIYVLTSPASGEMSLSYADAMLYDEDAGDMVGDNLAGPGDLNGDGYADLSAGASRHSLATLSGAFYVNFGPLAGTYRLEDADIRVEGVPGEDLGYRTTGAGDLDGDGYQDFAVAGTTATGSEEAPGKVSIFAGPLAPGLSMADAIATVEGELEASALGWSLDAAGDVDGDGFGDLLIGNPDGGRDEEPEAGAIVLYGPVTGLVMETEADLNLVHEEPSDFVGWSAAGAGDVNADGYDDLLVGAYQYSALYDDAGAAYLVLGGGI